MFRCSFSITYVMSSLNNLSQRVFEWLLRDNIVDCFVELMKFELFLKRLEAFAFLKRDQGWCERGVRVKVGCQIYLQFKSNRFITLSCWKLRGDAVTPLEGVTTWITFWVIHRSMLDRSWYLIQYQGANQSVNDGLIPYSWKCLHQYILGCTQCYHRFAFTSNRTNNSRQVAVKEQGIG